MRRGEAISGDKPPEDYPGLQLRLSQASFIRVEARRVCGTVLNIQDGLRKKFQPARPERVFVLPPLLIGIILPAHFELPLHWSGGSLRRRRSERFLCADCGGLGSVIQAGVRLRRERLTTTFRDDTGFGKRTVISFRSNR